jgi:hypothetical protein
MSRPAEDYDLRRDLRKHENAHTTQWLIPGFPMLYVLGALGSRLTTDDWFCGNPFERAAGPSPYYEQCGWDQSGGSGK